MVDAKKEMLKLSTQNVSELLQVNQSIPLSINREQAVLALRGIGLLSTSDTQSVVYTSLKKDLENIVSIWDKRIKNEKIIRANKAAIKTAPKITSDVLLKQ